MLGGWSSVQRPCFRNYYGGRVSLVGGMPDSRLMVVSSSTGPGGVFMGMTLVLTPVDAVLAASGPGVSVQFSIELNVVPYFWQPLCFSLLCLSGMGLLLIRAWRLVLPALLPGFSQAVGPTGWHLGPLLSLLTPQGMHELFCMRFGAGWATASRLCPWFLSSLALVHRSGWAGLRSRQERLTRSRSSLFQSRVYSPFRRSAVIAQLRER